MMNTPVAHPPQPATDRNRRILVVDDNREIHADFRKLLTRKVDESLDLLEAELFGVDASGAAHRPPSYDVDSAFQGQEGLARVQEARERGEPYALAFVDMRMPPGWDGVTTIEHVLRVDPEIQVVICTAYSEYSWEDIVKRFPDSDRLLILKKPFDTAEVCQLAAALSEKWHLAKRAHLKRAQLEAMVTEQTTELRETNTRLREEVAQRSATEHALRESRERFALAAAGARDGVWDWDLTSGQVHYSARWMQMLGLPAEASTEGPDLWLERVAEEDRAGLQAALENHFSGRSDYIQHEYRALHSDGQTRWLLCRGAAIRDAAGRALRVAGSQTDVSDRRMAEEQLRRLALHDPLTGLPNRALLLQRLERCIARAGRGETRFAALYMDLDRFKRVNDTLGHPIGDELLRRFADRVVACTRGARIENAGDPLARLGGDEFVLLLEGLADESDARAVADRVIAEASRPFELSGHTVRVGCSVGIAFGPGAGTSPDEILRHADIALYHAKSGGRNRCEVFDARIHGATLSRWRLEGEMREALGTGAFRVHYQPIVSMETGRVRSVEALVRWQHPRLGQVPPGDFIPLAEETGLIMPLALEVLQAACRDLRRWRDEYPDLADLRVAVNVSPSQVHRGGLGATFLGIVEAAGLTPDAVELEITESVLMDATPERLAELESVRAMGFGLHLDDFGTGYCSLSYLRCVRVDALKIDRSFVHALEKDAMTEPIIRAIVTLAHTFGMAVVAEGVETDGQRERMAQLGCDLAQGYLYLKAVGATELPVLLAGRGLCAAAS
jgi:diguanylate cyclase (GGDEF)-like protein/PAS domain S-box-containing protein